MPRISSFYGITIALYYFDHAPPHFYALYSGDEMRVRIDTLEVLTGSLPKRAAAMVIEWATQHQAELVRAWMQASAGAPPDRIEPLS